MAQTQFDTRVHHVDPVSLKIIKETPYIRYCRGDTVVNERPPHSGKFFYEDGNEADSDHLVALGLVKPADPIPAALISENEQLKATVAQLLAAQAVGPAPVQTAPQLPVAPPKKKRGFQKGWNKKPAPVAPVGAPTPEPEGPPSAA